MRAQVAPETTIEYDDAGQGRPVVLLHGFPFARGMWRPQLAELSQEFRVLVPDLRGFGGTSNFRGAATVEQMADDVADLLDAISVRGPVVLGGLSMGGYVALAFARKYAPRLRGLILADTRAEADTAEGKANRDRMIGLAPSHPNPNLVEQMLPKLVGEETRQRRPEVLAEVRQLAAAQTPAGITGALQAMRDRPDATPGLRDITVPTLVVVGSDDALTPPAAAQSLAQGIRDARLAVIQSAGHLSNLEQPEAFNAAVLTFLRTLP